MNELQKKPEIVVFAGPNGSGKSTFTELLKPPIYYINADEIKNNIKCSDIEAAQIAEKQREEHLANIQECYYDECNDWLQEDIEALTYIENMEKKALNI